jgi:hypothetical protein
VSHDPRSSVRPGDPLRVSAEQLNWINRQMRGGSQQAGAGAGRFHALGKTGSTWTKGTAQNVTVWAGAAGSEQATSDVLRAWNKFATVQAGKWVMLGRIGEHWYLIAAEC